MRPELGEAPLAERDDKPVRAACIRKHRPGGLGTDRETDAFLRLADEYHGLRLSKAIRCASSGPDDISDTGQHTKLKRPRCCRFLPKR